MSIWITLYCRRSVGDVDTARLQTGILGEDPSCEVVGIELGVSQLDDMGIVIAYEIARYLAQLGDGLVLNDEDEWLRVKDGGFLSVV